MNVNDFLHVFENGSKENAFWDLATLTVMIIDEHKSTTTLFSGNQRKNVEASQVWPILKFETEAYSNNWSCQKIQLFMQHSIYTMTVRPSLFFSFGTFNYSLAGLGSNLSVYAALAKEHKKQLNQFSNELRTYCSYMYSVVDNVKRRCDGRIQRWWS